MTQMPPNFAFNVVPFGRRGISPKPKKGAKLPFADRMPPWQQYQKKWYEGAISPNDNLFLVTGKQPGKDYQVVVFDFDGTFENLQASDIVEEFERLIIPRWNYQIVRTGHNGLHIYILCDDKKEIRGTQGKKLKNDIFPSYVKNVDIRACGSLVFYPPTKFSDTGEYTILYRTKYPMVAPSEQIELLISGLYVDAEVASATAIVADCGLCTSTDILPADETCDKEITSMRQPFRQLLSPGAPEIEALSASTGCLEELYWKGLFVEARGRGVSDGTVMRLLAKYQPNFDIDVTIAQLAHVGRTPFKNSTLERMFPWYTAPIRTNVEVIEENE